MTKQNGVEPEESNENETESPGLAKRAGEKIGSVAVSLFIAPFRFLGAILGGILGRFPKRTGVYRKMIKLGYKGLYKKTSAHVVAQTIYRDGEAVPRVAKIDSETGNLQTKNGEEWTVETGLEPVYVGDTPVVTGVADQHELVDHIGARVAEAVDIGGRSQAVQDTVNGVEPVTPESARNGSSTSVATDGGSGAQTTDTFSDIWVDTSNPEPDNDGWIISMEKAYSLHWDTAGSEEMENQETRGILAAQDPNAGNRRMILVGALILGAFALGLFGPALAQQLAGGASGGLGGGLSL